MYIHIPAICGTFMGGIAALAKAAGHTVTGSDADAYPPMSTHLRRLGIEVSEGYDVGQLDPEPDCVVIGNALSRGNPVIEAVLDRGLKYTSGPAWLADNVLGGRHVIAVAGTHGKTTTACMLAWILEDAGLHPGFLIGGLGTNFDGTAQYGESKYFVVEADEYDSAFFDKRSKFVHYRPQTLVLNNLGKDDHRRHIVATTESRSTTSILAGFFRNALCFSTDIDDVSREAKLREERPFTHEFSIDSDSLPRANRFLQLFIRH